MNQFRLAIVGSRLYPDRDAVFRYVLSLPKNEREFIIVTGGAMGVDDWAEAAARQAGLEVKLFHPSDPDYDHLPGPMRPLARNEDIVKHCDGLVAFWSMELSKDGKGSGTVHALKIALDAGKLIKAITPWGVIRPEEQR